MCGESVGMNGVSDVRGPAQPSDNQRAACAHSATTNVCEVK